MHVFTFEQEEWVVAASPEDAAAVYLEAMGPGADPLPNRDCDWEWAPLPDDQTFTLNDDGERITKTCAEWAAGGRRYLGSANY